MVGAHLHGRQRAGWQVQAKAVAEQLVGCQLSVAQPALRWRNAGESDEIHVNQKAHHHPTHTCDVFQVDGIVAESPQHVFALVDHAEQVANDLFADNLCEVRTGHWKVEYNDRRKGTSASHNALPWRRQILSSTRSPCSRYMSCSMATNTAPQAPAEKVGPQTKLGKKKYKKKANKIWTHRQCRRF